MISDETIRMVGDILLRHVSAPEQVVYRAAREALEAALSVREEVEAEKISANMIRAAREAYYRHQMEPGDAPFRAALIAAYTAKGQYTTPPAQAVADAEPFARLTEIQRLWDEHVTACDAYNQRLAEKKKHNSFPPRMGDLYQKMSAAAHAWHKAMERLVKDRIPEHASALVSTPPDLAERVRELGTALSAAEGYLMNALIDLQTGAPKKTAITTIEGGLKVVRAVLAKMEGER